MSDIRTRHLALIAFASLVALAVAQGGQGGFGGGGFGGGGGGGSAAAIAEGDEVVKTHILTPGDRGEWPITAKENETVIVSAQTTVFDAALEIVDKDGKVLAQNDDVRLGEQNPLLLYRFPKGGEYKILVKGYKSAAGGQYTFRLRRFVSEPTPIGAETTGQMAKGGVKWLRLSAQKDKALVVIARGKNYDHVETQFFAPNGEFLKEGEDDYIRQGSRFVLEPNATGDFYLRLSTRGNPSAKYSLRVISAREVRTAIDGGAKPEKLEAGGLHNWVFEAKEGDLVSIAGTAKSPLVLSVKFLPKELETEAPDAEVASDNAVRTLTQGAKGGKHLVALLRESGNYRVSVSRSLEDPLDYSLSVDRITRTLPEGAYAESRVEIGAGDLWVFDGKAGDIVQLEGSAEHFDMYLQVFGPNGDRVGYGDDSGDSYNPGATVLLTKTGRYAVEAGCMGGGGSGAYRIARRQKAVRDLPIGSWASGSFGRGATDQWRIQGAKNQLVVFQIRNAGFEPSVQLLGPDGAAVFGLQSSGEGGDLVFSVQLPADGAFFVWLAGAQRDGNYQIRRLDLEK